MARFCAIANIKSDRQNGTLYPKLTVLERVPGYTGLTSFSLRFPFSSHRASFSSFMMVSCRRHRFMSLRAITKASRLIYKAPSCTSSGQSKNHFCLQAKTIYNPIHIAPLTLQISPSLSIPTHIAKCPQDFPPQRLARCSFCWLILLDEPNYQEAGGLKSNTSGLCLICQHFFRDLGDELLAGNKKNLIAYLQKDLRQLMIPRPFSLDVFVN